MKKTVKQLVGMERLNADRPCFAWRVKGNYGSDDAAKCQHLCKAIIR